MSATAPNRRLKIGIGCVATAALLVAGAILAFKWLEDARDQNTRNRLRNQIEEVKSGKHTVINLSNEVDGIQISEFINCHKQLGQSDPYELDVSYSENVDDLLAQIAGARGLQSLLLYRTDITDLGLESIATLPDLRKVRLQTNPRTAVTSEKLDELRARLPACEIEILTREKPD